MSASSVARQWAPLCTVVAPLRRRVWPRLCGEGRAGGVALTYDDGPDPATTPAFLDLLDAHGVTATFFLLGEYVEANAALVRETTSRGHELAVHGWDHTCLAWKRPGVLPDELVRARAVVEDVSGQVVRWYRPPYGVLTGQGVDAASAAGLTTVLWTSWGRDWRTMSTPRRIVRSVNRTLRPGGTVLLHDTDRTSDPGSWRRTLAASDALLTQWRGQDLAVRPLRDHVA